MKQLKKTRTYTDYEQEIIDTWGEELLLKINHGICERFQAVVKGLSKRSKNHIVLVMLFDEVNGNGIVSGSLGDFYYEEVHMLLDYINSVVDFISVVDSEVYLSYDSEFECMTVDTFFMPPIEQNEFGYWDISIDLYYHNNHLAFYGIEPVLNKVTPRMMFNTYKAIKGA